MIFLIQKVKKHRKLSPFLKLRNLDICDSFWNQNFNKATIIFNINVRERTMFYAQT